jgi:hypothetical protein
MIAHTISCQIHISRHTTPFRYELRCRCSGTEILVLLTMNLELLSPLLSCRIPHFSRHFCRCAILCIHKTFRQKPRPRPAYCVSVPCISNAIDKAFRPLPFRCHLFRFSLLYQTTYYQSSINCVVKILRT